MRVFQTLAHSKHTNKMMTRGIKIQFLKNIIEIIQNVFLKKIIFFFWITPYRASSSSKIIVALPSINADAGPDKPVNHHPTSSFSSIDQLTSFFPPSNLTPFINVGNTPSTQAKYLFFFILKSSKPSIYCIYLFSICNYLSQL